MKNIFLIIFISLFWAASEKSKLPIPIEINAQVNKALVDISEDITLTVTIKAQEGLKYHMDEFGDQIVGLRVVDFGTKDEEKDGNYLIHKKWYKLSNDLSGSYILPEVKVSYKDPKDGLEKTIKTSEIFVEVKSPTQESDSKDQKDKKAKKDIRDIKKLVPPPTDYTWIWILGGMIFVFMTLTGIYIFYQKRKKKGPIIPPVPPHIEALNQLQELTQGNYLQQEGHLKYYHFTLSNIIRNYFEQVFQLQTTDMTFEEIKGQINEVQDLTSALKDEFIKILKNTDIVKFTDTKLSIEDSEELLRTAKSFVEKTSPQEGSTEESVI